MSLDEAIAAMRRAAGCEDCFLKWPRLTRTRCDLPQPRWIGPDYFSSSPRIAIVLINPGAGDTVDKALIVREADRFRAFYRTGDYAPIQTHFIREIERGAPWLTWYRDALALNPNAVAQLNIAWCPTQKNEYPAPMLKHCFATHTSGLLKSLSPDIVLLSGVATHAFESDLRAILPLARVITMLHYAHREGRKRELDEVKRVRNLISPESRKLPQRPQARPAPTASKSQPSEFKRPTTVLGWILEFLGIRSRR